jgi:outer membrane receptor protein involved in Fe transport
LTQRWRLFASLGRLDTELDRITTFDLDLSDFVERDGIEQAKAPNWQYHIGASFAPSPRLGARIELEGRDASRFGYYHDAEIGAYRLVNASIRYRFGNTELQLWGRNLTDEEYAVHGLYFGNDPRKGWVNETYRQLGEPRVVGLGVRHTF